VDDPNAGGSVGANVTVTLDPAYGQVVREAIRHAAPTTLDTLRDSAERLVAEARLRWPVGRPLRSGRLANPVHSRDRFVVREAVGADSVQVGIGNQAPYARFIRSMQKGLGGKGALQTLLLKPARAEAKRLAEQIGHELALLAGGD
jgi:hypothetical protein